jgi:hypothetical protein
MRTIVEEDRVLLHDLRGVSLRVDFFCSTDLKHVVSSTFWTDVDVRVDKVTYEELISELDFYHQNYQLFICDQVITGDVLEFRYEVDETGGVLSYCKMIINWY